MAERTITVATITLDLTVNTPYLHIPRDCCKPAESVTAYFKAMLHWPCEETCSAASSASLQTVRCYFIRLVSDEGIELSNPRMLEIVQLAIQRISFPCLLLLLLERIGPLIKHLNCSLNKTVLRAVPRYDAKAVR